MGEDDVLEFVVANLVYAAAPGEIATQVGIDVFDGALLPQRAGIAEPQ